jgi:hypothetical protein
MKLTLTPTEKLVSIDTLERAEVPRMIRVWEGTTEKGAKCIVLVAGVCVPNDQDQTEFDRELREFVPKWKDRQVFDLRQIL